MKIGLVEGNLESWFRINPPLTLDNYRRNPFEKCFEPLRQGVSRDTAPQQAAGISFFLLNYFKK
jgi:hypothetical protein